MICKYCGSEMSNLAVFCAECNHYKATWKNSTKFAASSVGLVTLIFAVMAFTVNKVIETYHSIVNHEQLTVINIGSRGELYLVNSGQYPIYLSNVIFSGGPINVHRELGGVIEPGELKTYSAPPQEENVNLTPAKLLDNGTAYDNQGLVGSCFSTLYFGLVHEALDTDPHKSEYKNQPDGEATFYYVVVGNSGAEKKSESVSVKFRTFRKITDQCKV